MARNVLTQARNVASTRTVLTYPRTPLGGVYIPGAKSIEGATGDIAVTGAPANQWIENKKYWWQVQMGTSKYSVEFDSAVTRTGRLTLKMSTTATDAVGGYVSSACTAPELKFRAVKLKPSTDYVWSCWVKTLTVPNNSVYLDIALLNIGGAVQAEPTSSKLSGTNDWTLLTCSFTTNASTIYGDIYLAYDVTGTIGDAWFDVNSMTLIETGVTRSVVT